MASISRRVSADLISQELVMAYIGRIIPETPPNRRTGEKETGTVKDIRSR
jgi:hypothetical protein